MKTAADPFQRFAPRSFRIALAGGLLLPVLLTASIAQTSKNDLKLAPYPLKNTTGLPLPFSIIFSYWRDIPMLDASVNGNLLHERVALSTGLNAMTLSSDAYTRNKVQALNSRYAVSAMELTEEVPAAQIKLFQFGNFQVTEVPFAIHDTSIQLLQKNRADAPGVWLGSPFLLSFQTTFDFPNRTLTLEIAKAALPKDEKRIELPLILQNNRPFVRVQAGSAKSFLALLDTGSPGTLIPSDTAAKLKLKPETTVPTRKPDGTQTSIGLASLPVLKIGGLEELNVRVGFLNPAAPVSFNKTFAVLGMNVLRKYRVCISPEKKKVVFLPPKTREETPEGIPSLP